MCIHVKSAGQLNAILTIQMFNLLECHNAIYYGTNLMSFQMQVPPVAQNKQMYFLKKRADPVDCDNYRELLLCGLLSPSLLLQLTSTVEQVKMEFYVLSDACHFSCADSSLAFISFA